LAQAAAAAAAEPAAGEEEEEACSCAAAAAAAAAGCASGEKSRPAAASAAAESLALPPLGAALLRLSTRVLPSKARRAASTRLGSSWLVSAVATRMQEGGSAVQKGSCLTRLCSREAAAAELPTAAGKLLLLLLLLQRPV
jgi:hypothetical protein